MGELEIFTIRIKELRNALNMTQRAFCEYIGVSQQTLSGYERGVMKPPLDVVVNIAKKCNISIDWLCGLSSDKNNKKELKKYSDVIQVINDLCNLETIYGTFSIYLSKEFDFEGNANYICGITISDRDLYYILNDLNKMREIRLEGTLDQNIFDTWYEGFLKKYDKEVRTWSNSTPLPEHQE